MERALLVTVKLERDKSTWDIIEHEHELEELAKTAGAAVVAKEICQRAEVTANLYVGEGKAEELSRLARQKNADVVIFNNDLSGTQHKNLEKALETKVVDRTQLILDIFARRAKSPEGKAQVELAQLEYFLPRLSGRGTELSRLGGGIGTRGPGEQKLEEDRRRIRDRIMRLKNDLDDLGLRRETLRSKRQEVSLPTVVFVGYTSAGKSTLFNSLTGSRQGVSRGLFTTLDPLSRAITLPNRQKVVLSDTVGFIRDLPHHLIEAFKATLEEAVEADLLVHVLDISSLKAAEHYRSVLEVLEGLGAGGKKTVLALNKTDLFDNAQDLSRACKPYPEGVPVSALRHVNLQSLLRRIEIFLADLWSEVRLVIPSGERKIIDYVYRQGRVKSVRYDAAEVRLEATLPAVAAQRLKRYLR